jgi:hypothetical protein
LLPFPRAVPRRNPASDLYSFDLVVFTLSTVGPDIGCRKTF